MFDEEMLGKRQIYSQCLHFRDATICKKGQNLMKKY